MSTPMYDILFASTLPDIAIDRCNKLYEEEHYGNNNNIFEISDKLNTYMDRVVALEEQKLDMTGQCTVTFYTTAN